MSKIPPDSFDQTSPSGASIGKYLKKVINKPDEEDEGLFSPVDPRARPPKKSENPNN